jgi:hypothetical protein
VVKLWLVQCVVVCGEMRKMYNKGLGKRLDFVVVMDVLTLCKDSCVV